jgi:hypothetical protein
MMTLKSHAHILTNHNHTVLTDELLRDQETAHHMNMSYDEKFRQVAKYQGTLYKLQLPNCYFQ